MNALVEIFSPVAFKNQWHIIIFMGERFTKSKKEKKKPKQKKTASSN